MTAESQSFDFIGDEALRSSLQQDLNELQIAVQHGAHKAVVVLAGSIIEALLLDHLISTDHENRTGGKPLTYNFPKLIEVCNAEGVIAENTVHLLQAVRDYRNLIHPGRSLRTKDKVHPATAAIASNVVTLISSEMAVRPNRQFGMTAEQVIAKVRHDPQIVLMPDHLLADVREPQLDKLLLKIAPTAIQEETEDDTRRVLARLYRQCFVKAKPPVKQQAMTNLYDTIRVESGERVRTALSSMFSGWHLAHADGQQAKLILERILVETRPSGMTLPTSAYEHLLNTLTAEDAVAFATRLYDRLQAWDEQKRNEVADILLPYAFNAVEPSKIEEAKQRFEETINALRSRVERLSSTYHESRKAWFQRIIDSSDIPF